MSEDLDRRVTVLEATIGPRFDELERRLGNIDTRLAQGSETFVDKEVFEARIKPLQLFVYGVTALLAGSVITAIVAANMVGPASYGG